MGPPCAKKYEIAQLIAKKYNICHVSISDLLKKEIQAKNENSIAILASMNSGELVNDRYVLKLLEDRLYASDCMINGWILTGFPKNSAQMNYFEFTNPSFNPSLIISINLYDDDCKKRSEMRRIDPVTGKIHYIDSFEYSRESDNVKNRLLVKIEDKPEVLSKR
jgi:adenylate kinase